jgi:uncharacterized protein (TIGR02118 family)
MIVVSVLYPVGHDFDMAYYRDSHLPLVRRLLEPAGMTSLTYFRPDQPSPYQLIAELRFASRADMEQALAAHGPETQADIPAFTAAPPVILIGDEFAA